MQTSPHDAVIQQYHSYVQNRSFPCVAAKAALQRRQIAALVVPSMAEDSGDAAVLEFLYGFVDRYRAAKEFFHSAAIIFEGPHIFCEGQFEAMLWQRLQGLADLDSRRYGYDARVSAEPDSAKFSFSVKEEAFFIVGLHPKSSRQARRFAYPTLVFNPHRQFEQLREKGRYAPMQSVIRKRDIALSGSVNPMLDDFGGSSEAHQYSGRQHGAEWQCPLKIHHERHEDHTPA